MTLYRAVVEVLIEADHEADVVDAVAEMLLPLIEDDKMLDWQYATSPDGIYGKPTEISSDAAEVHFDEFTAK